MPLCAAVLLALPGAAQTGGNLDSSFMPNISGGGPLGAVKALPGGKVLVGGSLIAGGVGAPVEGVTRLNADGSPDPGWNGGSWGGFSSAYPTGVQHLLLLPGGKHIAAGTGNNAFFLIQSDATGAYDFANFNVRFFESGTLLTIDRQSTGQVLVGGLVQPGTIFEKGLGAMSSNGTQINLLTGAGISLEATFRGHVVAPSPASVTAIAVQPDNKIIVAGNFTHFGGMETGNIIRLNADGTFDNTFDAGFGSFDTAAGHFVAVHDLAPAPGGGVYAATSLPSISTNANRIVRLTATGAHDPGFVNFFVFGGDVRSIDVNMAGQVLVGGPFVVAGSPSAAGIALLEPNGLVNPEFRGGMGSGFAAPGFAGISSVDFTLDGAKALAAGSFSFYNGAAIQNLARIHVSLNPFVLPNNEVVCSGTVVSAVSVGTPPPGYTYTWTNSDPSIGLAASGSNMVPSFTAVNNGMTPVTAEIRLTATETATGMAKTYVYRITVKPLPTVNAVSNQSLCVGQTGSVSFSGSLSGTTYKWTNSNTAIGLSAVGTNDISFTAMNPANTDQLANITVTPLKDACTGAPETFSITVSPTAGSISYGQSSYCQGGSAFVRMTASSRGGIFSATPAGLVIDANSGQVSLASSAAGTYTVTYTVNATAPCTATATTQLTVKPQVSVNAVGNEDLCVGVPSSPIVFTGNATSYTWTNDNTGIGLAASGTGNIGSFTPTGAGIGVIYVTPQGDGASTCPGKARVFRLRVDNCTVTTPGDTGGDAGNARVNLLAVSPNPATNSTMVQYNGTESGPFVLEVVNAFGQPALRPLQLTGKTARLDLSGLMPGVYQLRLVNTRTGTVSQKQVIKL
ncbi:T9SS type A sorting domain-containing protein [Flaviaesturariibacter amylovorans]|uniref:T9SS type A sorting domain-containing protein n=1 Tax=Flaviaesturariibacter amylovorans TaxID=1084520 RepID=A0ABP8HJY0_9BACT